MFRMREHYVCGPIGDLGSFHGNESTSETMSTPLSQLKKVQKSPLPKAPSVPFRNGHGDEMLGFVPELDAITQKYVVNDIRKQARARPINAPRDVDLVSSMAARLAVVEKELLSAKREIVEKVQGLYAMV